MNAKRTRKHIIPVLPLRDVVVFPYMVMPLFVGREKSINALDQAMLMDKKLLLVSQKKSDLEEPQLDDVYSIGTIADIIQILKLPDGTIKVLIEGKQRAKINRLDSDKYLLSAEIELLDTVIGNEQEISVLKKVVLEEFEKYSQLTKKPQGDMLSALKIIEDAERLADSMSAHLPISVEKKQKLLEEKKLISRFEYLLSLMEVETDIVQVEKRVRTRVKEQMEKNQRDYYLHEQIKAIQKELGENENTLDEIARLQQKINDAKMPSEARQKVEQELQKLKMMAPMSSEASVVRSYIDWMLQVPWYKRSKVKKDISKAQQVLDSEHYGLERVKERILEYLAVQARLNQMKAPILCLVGPPGVGKTSLGQSIANATGRKYVRMALGGVRDEAEIRGHRRTYIGSLPGKLIQKMAKVGVKNPLFLLDEIDKMSSDMRGDPASALLEVLDPEQNNSFNDHYLEVDYDLSEVMFVATSNSMNIPEPLLDRMEVIRLAGYTEDEKLNIAVRHLISKQFERNGLKANELTIDNQAIIDIIRFYTREAGVRGLEREISKICRKAVKRIFLEPKTTHIDVTSDNLHDFLGVRRFEYGRADTQNRIGEVTGLAWTSVGGDLLTIEATSVLGKGKLGYTGSLGQVMKESIQTAMTVVRARAEKLGINNDFHEKRDIHIHVPDGATPKDGPSAGIAMCTALVSCLTGNPVKSEVAMTGEISLRGKVLPIGGLKEKLLAAHRGGISTVIIPKENVKDLEDIPANAKENLQIHAVETIDEVLLIALEKAPEGVEFIQHMPINQMKKAKTRTSKKNTLVMN